MRFLLDEDVPDEIAQVLKHLGHEVTRARDALPVEADDAKVFDFAQTQGLVVISCNRDHFLALARTAFESQPARPFHGLIVLIRRRSRQAECAHLLSLLRRAGESGVSGNINFA